jgi:serine/threonine protein kinase
MAGRIASNYNGRLPIEGRTYAYNEEAVFDNQHVKFYGGYDERKRHIGIKKIQNRGAYKAREIEILKTLNHPHIVRCGASMIDAYGNAFIVMDLARGTSLDTTHPHNFQKTSTIKTLAYQLFESLEYLHNKNIIHYDLCDRNIFWDPKTNALTLIDFDAAQHVGTEHTGGRTALFAAPEVLFKKRNHTTQVDLWSAGCVIYYLFEGYLFDSDEFSLNKDQQVLINVLVQLGPPTREYFFDCGRVFDIADLEKQPAVLEETLRVMLEKRNLDEAEQSAWIHLFTSLIKYEDRGKAQDYLTHPLFASLIKIQVVVEQALSLSISQGEEVIYSEDFAHPAKECVHLTRSPEYTLTATMDGKEKKCNRPLIEGEILHVKSLFVEPPNPKAAEPTSKKSKPDL